MSFTDEGKEKNKKKLKDIPERRAKSREGQWIAVAGPGFRREHFSSLEKSTDDKTLPTEISELPCALHSFLFLSLKKKSLFHFYFFPCFIEL